MGAVTKPKVKVTPSKYLKLISGRSNFETEHLMGVNRHYPFHSTLIAFNYKNSNEQRFEFFFQKQSQGQAEEKRNAKSEVKFTFDYERGGVLETEILI